VGTTTDLQTLAFESMMMHGLANPGILMFVHQTLFADDLEAAEILDHLMR
jgi:hypothetical protein